MLHPHLTAPRATVFHLIWQHITRQRRRLKTGMGLFVVGLLLPLLLFACQTEPTQSPLQPLKVGITTWPGFDIALYAQAADLFKKRGLDVEIVRFDNQQDSARAVLRGALDASFSSLWDVMQVDPGTDKPAVIMVTDISHGSDGLLAKAGIDAVKQLTGKRVGATLGTVNHLILLEALKLHGVKPAAVTIENVSNETAVEMMAKGQLDGAVLWQPLLGETAKQIKGNIVFTTKDVDSLVIDTLMSRVSTIASKKAELTAFITAWLDVMHAVETKPNTVYELVGKQLGQTGAAFGSDYAGLKKGDITMQRRMFQDQSRLQEALTEMAVLLQQDPRAGRTPRKDLIIDGELVTAAIAGWQP